MAHRCDFTCKEAFQIFNFRGIEALSYAEFCESLFSYIGNSYYNRDQAYLLFTRYDADMDSRLSYREWVKLVVPTNPVLSRLLLGRNPVADRVSSETQELLKRLLRAHLNLEQAHEYLRQRLARTRGTEEWTLRELFDAID